MKQEKQKCKKLILVDRNNIIILFGIVTEDLTYSFTFKTRCKEYQISKTSEYRLEDSNRFFDGGAK